MAISDQELQNALLAVLIGETIRLTVTSVLQTSAGRMIFGRIEPGTPPGRSGPAGAGNAAAGPPHPERESQGRHNA